MHLKVERSGERGENILSQERLLIVKRSFSLRVRELELEMIFQLKNKFV